MAVKRGCGTRQEGGIYICTGLSDRGRPIEDFLIDPPIRLDPALGVTPVGVTLVTDSKGVTHVIDWVGSQHYPNVADFVEEVRRFGLSRRAARTLDYSRLTRESRIILVHARGIIENTDRYWQATPWQCPMEQAELRHAADRPPSPTAMCAQLYWHDVEGGEKMADSTFVDGALDQRFVRREMPSFAYHAHRAPDYAEPLYTPAMFLRLPITNLEVVRARDGAHRSGMDAAQQSNLPVTLEDE